MSAMYPEYEKMLDQGIYENEEDLCNGEGINYDDLYMEENDEEDED